MKGRNNIAKYMEENIEVMDGAEPTKIESLEETFN